MTFHTMMCFLINLSKKTDVLRMYYNNALIHQKADQCQTLRDLTGHTENFYSVN